MFVVVIVYLSIKIISFVLSGSDCFRFGLMTTLSFACYGSYFFVVVAVVVVVFFIMTQESRIRNSLY